MKLFSFLLRPLLILLLLFFSVPNPLHAPCFCLFVLFFKWEHLLSCTRNRLPVCTVFVCRHVPGRYVHSAESSPSHRPTAPTQPPRPSFVRPKATFFAQEELTWLVEAVQSVSPGTARKTRPHSGVRVPACAQLQTLVVT